MHFQNTKMRSPFFSLSTLLLVVLGVLSGCATPRSSVYQHEDFDSASTFSRRFPASAAATCEAARRALLSQGYVINQQETQSVQGNKNFQPDRDTHIEIAFHVVCAPDGVDGNTATAFANALQDKFIVKKNPNSASVGLSALGSVSLPFGSSEDSLAKVASETIQTDKFYERFYGLIEHYLDLAADQAAPATGAGSDAMDSTGSGSTDEAKPQP